jgi:hypothetical protein
MNRGWPRNLRPTIPVTANQEVDEKRRDFRVGDHPPRTPKIGAESGLETRIGLKATVETLSCETIAAALILHTTPSAWSDSIRGVDTRRVAAQTHGGMGNKAPTRRSVSHSNLLMETRIQLTRASVSL